MIRFKKIATFLAGVAWMIALAKAFSSAQTKTQPNQISAKGLTVQVLVVNQKGDVTFADIDSSLTLDVSGPKPVLKATAAAVETVDVQVLTTATSVINLSKVPTDPRTIRCHRNGVLLSPGVDYSVTGGAITFVPAQTPQPDDVMNTSYR